MTIREILESNNEGSEFIGIRAIEPNAEGVMLLDSYAKGNARKLANQVYMNRQIKAVWQVVLKAGAEGYYVAIEFTTDECDHIELSVKVTTKQQAYDRLLEISETVKDIFR